MQFALGKTPLPWYGHPVRATHPNLLTLPLLAAALIALNPLTAVAANLDVAHGTAWMDKRSAPITQPILSRSIPVPLKSVIGR